MAELQSLSHLIIYVVLALSLIYEMRKLKVRGIKELT